MSSDHHSRRRRSGGRDAHQWSGPGPDGRDPQLLSNVLGKLMRDRGWRNQAAHAGVFARWNQIIGPEIAEHCRVVSCERGELVIEAESSAWATQLRLFKSQMLTKITSSVGPGVVTHVRIHGPSQPNRVMGPRRVRYTPRHDRHG